MMIWHAIPFVRDRLRCPNCKAVGTWKPHGGYFDRLDLRGAKRWLCKWCGYYRGPEGDKWCAIHEHPFWELKDDIGGAGRTPKEIVESELGANPWNG